MTSISIYSHTDYMLDQLFGLLMFGLGLSGPSTPPSVKGDSDTTESSSDASLKTEPLRDKEQKIKKISREVLYKETNAASASRSGKSLEKIKIREDELENLFENRKERLNEELKTRREEAVEKFKEEREAFKEKVSQIRDTKKKAVVTRIDSKIAEINKKRTEQMTERLSKMSEILDKVGVRSSESSTTGKDVSAVDTLVSAARIAVTSAQTAVSTQAGKVYVADIASEDAIGDAMNTALKSLQTDLTAVQKLVKSAQLAVQSSVKELGKIMDGGTN